MKKIIALVAMIASAQVSAFWFWGDNRGHSGTGLDGAGYADGVGEADFSFDLKMTARFSGWGNGSGAGYGNTAARSSYIPYYAAPYGYLPPEIRPEVAE